MKPTLKIIIIILFSYCKLYSQEETIKLPNVTTPSPEAYALTKFGNVPVNESTGMVNQTIPLYTYKVQNLELPITINYSGAGVKVDELPSWTGIKWTLSAGGVITRSLKDKPDEMVGSNNRILLSDSQITDYSTDLVNGSAKAEYMYDLVENSSKDTEVDIFNFNFPGYSGSFYFDVNFQGVLLKNDTPLKIETIGNFSINKTILITAPDGVKYFFGGIDAIEDTEIRYVQNTFLQKVNSQGTTSFYLSKIEHPIFGEINLTYQHTNVEQSIVLTKEQSKNGPSIWIAGLEPDSVENCLNHPYDDTSVTTITVVNRILNPIFLSEISCPYSSERINFFSTNIDNNNFKRVLNKIKVFNSGEIVKTIDFEYTEFTENPINHGPRDITKRFFLKRIIFDNDIPHEGIGSGRKNEIYSFEYNDYNALPQRFSYAQDNLGYFNGVTNNTNLIPDNPVFNPNHNPGFADRSPDFDFASKGVLTHIYYPTGGFTQIEYESPKVKRKNLEEISLYAHRNIEIADQFTDGVPRMVDGGYDEGGFAEFDSPIPFRQSVVISVSLYSTLINNVLISPRTEYVTLKVKNITGSPHINILERVVYLPSPGPGPYDVSTISNGASFGVTFIEGQRYSVEIEIPDAGTASLEAFASFSSISSYQAVDDCGVRVKRVTDYSNETSPSNVKRYYYTAIDKTTIPIRELRDEGGNSYKTSESVYPYVCELRQADHSGGTIPLSLMEYAKTYNTLYSNSYDNFFGSDAQYEIVTTSFGSDDFQNGGVEKTFFMHEGVSSHRMNNDTSVNTTLDLDEYVTKPEISNPPILIGQLLNEKVFSLKNNTLYKIKESIYGFDFSQTTHINNIMGQKLYPVHSLNSGVSMNNHISNYYIGTYRTISYKNEMTSSEIKEYIDPVPFNVTDESGYNKIVITQNYEYGSLRGLPIRITTSTSDLGTEKSVRNYYPADGISFNNLSALHLNGYNKLVSQNRVSKPVQVETYSDTELLSKQRTLYKAWNDMPNLVLPEFVQTAKDSQDLESRLFFTKYDTFGNLMEVSLQDGSKTRYYYNSNRQVIVKIENYIEPASGSAGELPEDTPVDEVPEGCDLHLQYPKSLVTTYEYNTLNQIVEIKDHNCKITYYEYDAFHRLKKIKDNDGNVLKEFDTNFRR